MSKVIFADTSGIMPYLVPALPEHKAVFEITQRHMKEGGTFVTTNYVLTELVALLSTRTRFSRPQILSGIESVLQSPCFDIVHITPELHQQAFGLPRARPDKNWSWVDAASFIVMRQKQLMQALTTDHHFEQAGFERLIKGNE